ncbi:MAG: M28 family peptidase [Elusimicrobia bacterium]|nr:M28 family peptidase [Elusimicrobiota bacterium]
MLLAKVSTELKPKRLLVMLSVPVCALLVLGWLLRQPILPPPPAAPGGPAAEPARLEAHVRMLSETLAPRDAAHPARLDRAAAYIRAEFKASGAAVTELEYTFQERNQRNKLEDQGPFRNVMARFGPESGDRIVVGAHYDAAGEKPGADDNASGVAGLLELARLLRLQAPPIRVDLVAYSTEEPPYYGTAFMGSGFHARALREEGAAVRAMLSLEMLGAFSDAPGSQRYPAPLARLFYPGRGNFIAVAGRYKDAPLARRVKRAMWAASPLPVYSLNSPPGVPGIPLSDHASYWDAGFPALMVTDTAFYRNERYHTAEDTADRLDYGRMAMVVNGVHAAVLDLAR